MTCRGLVIKLTDPDLTQRDRLKLMGVTLALTVGISWALDLALSFPGQCMTGPAAPGLQAHYYPSIEAGCAFSLVFPLLGRAIMPLAFIAALIVSALSVISGMSSWYDICISLAVSGLSYSISEGLIYKHKKTVYKEDEMPRKILHALVGLFFCAIILTLGMDKASMLVLAGTFLGILNIHLVLFGLKLPGTDLVMDKFERGGVMPGEGSLYYALGTLFTVGLLRDCPGAAIAVILMLAIGDSLATIVGGRYGRRRLPWNCRKTVVGSAAFMAGAMCSLIVVSSAITILIAALATLIESLPVKADDNITVPVAASLLFYFLIGTCP
jgi:dolichol kinase